MQATDDGATSNDRWCVAHLVEMPSMQSDPMAKLCDGVGARAWEALRFHRPKTAKTRTNSSAMTRANFIPPMLLLRKERPPERPDWRYESKHGGHRAFAFRPIAPPILDPQQYGFPNENTGCWI